MTATFPISTPSASTKPITFAVGTLVRVQHNEGLYKIDAPAAWADGDQMVPTHYNVTGPGGKYHRMVPAERLILRADTMGEAAYADREFLEIDAIVRNHEPRVKHTHCWRCATEISPLTTKVCLKCKCGDCRCNWPYASRSTGRAIDVAF